MTGQTHNVCHQSKWTLQIERGPECLFIKPTYHPASDDSNKLPSAISTPTLDSVLIEILEQHFVDRLVLEISELSIYPNEIVDALFRLQERLEMHGGMLHFSGDNRPLEQALKNRSFAMQFFPGRAQAIMRTIRRAK